MTLSEQREAARQFANKWNGKGRENDDASLADLYDPLTMPPELRKAHNANDQAVMQAYGFNVKTMSEAGCVAVLMKNSF